MVFISDYKYGNRMISNWKILQASISLKTLRASGFATINLRRTTHTHDLVLEYILYTLDHSNPSTHT